MELRPVQEKALNAIRNALKSNDRVLCQACTGFGKTVLFAKICELTQKNGSKILITVPKNILIDQTIEKLVMFIPRDTIGIYNAGKKEKDFSKRITIASLQSLDRAKDIPRFDLTIVDEAHRLLNTQKRVIKGRAIGMTATPRTPSGLIYPASWPFPCFSVSLEEMTALGFLCPIVCSEGKGKLDLASVKISKGDYVVSDLVKIYTDEKLNTQIDDLIKKTLNRKKVIIMATSIDHCERIYNLLMDKTGVVDSSILHSKLNTKTRVENLSYFKEYGKYLVSVLIASEGFDFPGADCLALMRPTRSVTLYEQAVGRIARTAPGKENGLLLDYGSVVETLGLVYEITEFETDLLKTKVCSECDTHNPINERSCCFCGSKFILICSECLSPKFYGESCCESDLAAGNLSDKDQLKNLTETAYEEILASDWIKITKVELSKYVSKKGNNCLEVTYYSGMFNPVHTNYHSNGYFLMNFISSETTYNGTELESLVDNQEKYVKVPTRIKLVKSGKYYKITETEFGKNE